MQRTPIPNPFVVGKYVSDEYFCDREQETEFLRKQIDNGRNVALISPRRLGKSGLIQHLFCQPDLLQRYYVFFIDIYATTSLPELVYLMGKAIYEQLKPQSTRWKERFFQVVRSLQIGYKLDTLGMPTLDLGLGDIVAPQTTLDEIFAYLEEADRPCIVAIDEFQQIGEYGGLNVEALLRTKIQQCHTTQFIFSGSKRHVMSLMFNSPSKPFYQSAISMGLDAIPVDTYTDFAQRLFSDYGKQVERDTVERVWQQYEGYTWYVQMLMNELFALPPAGGTCTPALIATAEQNVIQTQEAAYKEILSNLPPRQKVVLQAIAREGIARNITSATFIKKYSLGSASSVQAAVKLLLKNDIVTHSDGQYRIYDFFFSKWLARY